MDASPTADKVMEFTLRHVPFDGWTADALKRGATDAGIEPQQALDMFGSKPMDLITYYSRMLDRKMKERAAQIDLASMKIRDRIASLLMMRIDLMGPYREAAQKAATVLSLPTNVTTGTKLMYETVDLMWRLAGDKSTDFSYYTKRATLSAVYSSTLLYWFRDMSHDYMSTREFLNRRLDNVMAIPKIKSKIKDAAKLVTKPLRSIFRHRHDKE